MSSLVGPLYADVGSRRTVDGDTVTDSACHLPRLCPRVTLRARVGVQLQAALSVPVPSVSSRHDTRLHARLSGLRDSDARKFGVANLILDADHDSLVKH